MGAVKRRSAAAGRLRPQDIDRHVGMRIRQRRIMLGLTQQQMADLIGVTYQQAHKYERGINRVAAGRLYQIAQALGVDVGYFFEGLEGERSFEPTPQQRLLLELARHFVALDKRRYQEALVQLARTLASESRGQEQLALEQDVAVLESAPRERRRA